MADPPIEPTADEIDRVTDRERKFWLAMIGELRVENAMLKAENKNVKAQNWQHIVEKAERDAPSWSTLVRAAKMEGCEYDRVLRWTDRALAAGRTNEARVDTNGRKWANRRALRAYLRG